MPFEMAIVGNEADEIRKKLGTRADDLHPLGPRVVVAVYERSDKKTAGGVIIPGTVGAADRSQGKVGLLIKQGPLAFQEDEQHRWGDAVPQVGDWVVYRVGDTVQMDLGNGDLRLRVVEDVDIIMTVDRPDVVS